ncbi:MAG: sensor histidine kinase [Promethearchaeota archaeon]
MIENQLNKFGSDIINLLDNVPVCIIIIKEDLTIEWINKQTEVTFNLNKNNLINKPIEFLFKNTEEYKKKINILIDQAFEGIKIENKIVELPQSDQTLVNFILSIYLIREKRINKLLLLLIELPVYNHIKSNEIIFPKFKHAYSYQITDNYLNIIAKKAKLLKFTYNLKTGEIQLDGAIEKILGYQKEELQNLTEISIQKFFHPDERELIITKIKESVEKKEDFIEKFRFKRKDGKFITLEWHGTLIFNERNKTYTFLCILFDISEHEITKEQLKRDMLRYKLITENANDLIWVLDEDFRVEYVNESQLNKLLNYNLEEFLGLSPSEIIYDMDKEKIFLSLKKCIDFGECKSEVRFIKKDGSYIWLENKGKLFKDYTGRYKILIISRDISERKKYELKLKNSEERYRNIIENISEGYLEVDLGGNLIFFNERICEMLKYNKEELLGKNYKEITDEETAKDIYNIFHELFLKKEGSKLFEFKLINKDKEEIIVESSVYLLKDLEGHIIGFKGFLRDITRRKEIENIRKEFNETLEQQVVERTKELNEALEKQKLYFEQILRSSQFKTEFLSTMSHELRTPLNAIIGFTDLLLEGIYGELNEDQIEVLKDIRSSAQHEFDMVKNILDISKIESGKLELHYEWFSLNNIVKQIKATIKSEYKKKNLKFKIKGLDKPIKIFADPLRFKEILLNLLSNAIKFTEEGYFSLSIKEAADKWIFKIKDTGIGIAKKDFDIIFKDFKRVDSPYVRATEGTGLGLSLTKRLVNLHGGEITFHSVLGVGTTFTFTIPKPKEEYLK